MSEDCKGCLRMSIGGNTFSAPCDKISAVGHTRDAMNQWLSIVKARTEKPDPSEEAERGGEQDEAFARGMRHVTGEMRVLLGTYRYSQIDNRQYVWLSDVHTMLGLSAKAKQETAT